MIARASLTRRVFACNFSVSCFFFILPARASKKTRKEVKEALDIFSDLSSKNLLENVYTYYNQIYGMRRAFKAFFYNLDTEEQAALNNAIVIYKNTPNTNGPEIIKNIDESIRFLEDFRNSFAHGFVNKYQIPTLGEAKELNMNNYSGTVYQTNQTIKSDGSFDTIMTSNLLGIMKSLVINALWAWIKRQKGNINSEQE